MLPTYPATLRDDRIEWNGDAPPDIGARAVDVLVTLIAPTPPQPRGIRMAAALEKLAGSAVAAIADPVAWQREQRADRELPGRAE